MAKNLEVVPALLCKSKKEFIKKLHVIESYVKRAQYDIMDNKFVKNRTVQPKELRGFGTPVKIEAQLMVKDPADYLSDLCRMNAWMVIFHYESYKNAEKIKNFIKMIRTHKKKVGIAINPSTPAAKIKQYLKLVDLALVMTVKPGFGGQKLIPSTLKKVKQIRKWNKNIDIEVDGGINSKTAPLAIAAGANVLVAGGAVFKAKTVQAGIAQLKGKFK